MRKLIVSAVVAIAAALATAGPAMATTTDSCVEFGPGPVGAQSCFTTTSETNVNYGVVKMGRYSAGSFTLVCTTRYHEVFIKQGNIGTGGQRTFFTEGLFGLRDPDCSLSAHARNTKVNRRASATVTLVD